MSAERRGIVLVGVSLALSAALIGIFLAAGGSSYTPVAVQDPCEEREWRDPGSLEQIAEQFSLSALDGAACELGVSRETLARALATPRSRERFNRRYGIDDAELARAIRAGLLRAIDDAERAGALSPLIADPLRETVREIPLEDAIELIRGGRAILDSAQSFLGPAEDLLERFFR
jgi:hypothetical protein